MAELRSLSVDDDDGWDELAALFTQSCREAIPDERASSAEEWRSGHRAARRRTHYLLAVEEGHAVGAAAFGLDDIRTTSAWLMFLFVAPEYRRRGIGSSLFDAVREIARADGRMRIETSTYVDHPAGTAFAQRAGARAGLVTEQSRCPTSALDAVQLAAWRERAAQRAAGYSLVSFDGVCPEEHLDAFVAAVPIMNTAPRSEDAEEFAPNREQLRESMSAVADQGIDIWTVCARHDGTGQFVGYTELFLAPTTPWMAAQGDTGVHPDHRERGIGRWLKAHSGLRLLAERPEVEFIQTWNASVNAAMLSINRAMGFQVVARRQQWDVPV